ncbi:membrane-spanning 4-domains subfamily A member 4D-like isoform X3 [Lissotriton helveticus]
MALQVGNGVYLLGQYIPSGSSVVQHEQYLLQKFIKGEPKILGAIQIMIGIISFFFGATICSPTLQSFSGFTGAPFWGGFCFLISGSLSIAAEKKQNYCLIYHDCILSFLLLVCCLEFCISISTSCFGCKVVCDPEEGQPLFIVQNNNTQEPRLLPTQATMMPLPAQMSYGISVMQGASLPATPLPPPYSYIHGTSTASQA